MARWWVLHVGTGPARLMVVTVDTCAGPRAYAGLASSYFEHVTEGYQRMDDAEWQAIVSSTTPPPEVPWLGGIVVHQLGEELAARVKRARRGRRGKRPSRAARPESTTSDRRPA